MSEHEGLGAAMSDNQAGHGGTRSVTAGAILRHARESMGVHIAALAVALKVPVSKLDALESDRYEEFPDLVFMRALAASVCRTLKIDSSEVLALLPSGVPQTPNFSRGLNASFKDPTGRFRAQAPLERPNKSRWVGLLVGVLLVGALAVALYPRTEPGVGMVTKTVEPGVPTETAPGAAEPVAAEEPAPAASDAPAAVASAPSTDLMTTSQAAAAGARATLPAPGSAPALQAVAPASAASAAVAGDSSRGLELRAREESWVKIVSAQNGVVLERLLKAGETVVAGGSPPWNVTVGRPDATDVFVRGQQMSMDSYPRGKVARFEVK